MGARMAVMFGGVGTAAALLALQLRRTRKRIEAEMADTTFVPSWLEVPFLWLDTILSGQSLQHKLLGEHKVTLEEEAVVPDVDYSDRISEGVLDLGSLFEDEDADAKLNVALPTLCGLSGFKGVNLGGNTGLTPSGWQAVGEQLLQCLDVDILELHIQDCDLTAAKLGALAPWIKQLKGLKTLQLGYNRDLDRDWILKILGEDFIKSVAVVSRDVLFQLPTTAALTESRATLACETIAEEAGEELDLAECLCDGVLDLGSQFEDDDADERLRAALPSLRNLSGFTVLNIGGNTGLTDIGWQIFGDKLLHKWSSDLETLYMQDCDLTFEKLGAVAPWLRRLPALKTVFFGYNCDLDRDWMEKVLGVDFLARVQINTAD